MSETGPLLSFPGGVPQDVSELSLSLGEKKRKRQMAGSLHGLAFKAQAQDIGDKDGSKRNICKYAVAKVNVMTSNIEIMPTRAIFVMRPQVGKGEDLVPAHLSDLTPDEKRKSLTQEFEVAKNSGLSSRRPRIRSRMTQFKELQP